MANAQLTEVFSGFVPAGPAALEALDLLGAGPADAGVGPRHGTWWQRQLPDARLEVAPGAGHLLVIPMWHRALSHLAPRRGR